MESSEVLYNVVKKPILRKETKTDDTEEDNINERGNEKSLLNLKKPKALYIYDFVKVKVLLNEHFYVLSRHMISRMLMMCRIKKIHALNIARDLKKNLVESNKLEVSQEEIECQVFKYMEKYEYTDLFVERYKMISNFYRNRVPLVIIISGTICSGTHH